MKEEYSPDLDAETRRRFEDAERRRNEALAHPERLKRVVPPGKWDAPIGLDDSGKPFPIPAKRAAGRRRAPR